MSHLIKEQMCVCVFVLKFHTDTPLWHSQNPTRMKMQYKYVQVTRGLELIFIVLGEVLRSSEQFLSVISSRHGTPNLKLVF